MKKILLACGSGIVTSTHAANRLSTELDKRGYKGKFKITQCRVSETVAKSSDFDFCVATTQVPPGVECPVLHGIAFLTGVGVDEIMEKVIVEMQK